MDRFFWKRVFPVLFYGMLGLALVSGAFTGYSAYKAGCLQSMALNGVCASNPQIDKWFK